MKEVKQVQCKICSAWVDVGKLEAHIAKEHGTNSTLTPQSVFGVR